MADSIYPKIAYTIENQLEAYSRAERHTERHEILWHAWNQNKIWLSQLLELTLPAFPAYSRHDESHAKSVIHNIERILGEDRIKQLSASDCFMLLHVAYVHDIGMCITADDREQILRNDGFIEMVDRFLEEGDEDQQKEARNLLQTTYIGHEGLNYKKRNQALKEKYGQKLQLYYAIIYLVSEYQRKNHGEESADRIHKWTESPDQLGTGFSMSGIPLRLFLRIADCAVLHTDWDFSHVLDLPQEDSGYTHDMIHPRFVAVMLQLGDALDMDNDRFHLFTQPFVGQLPEMSELHFQKHQAIRQLKISPQEISIEADCTTQAALRQVRIECDGIESILKSASHHWSEISPKELSGCLPTMRPLKIKLKGNPIPKELVTAKFDIEQKKAFQLMEGANVYFGKLVFLRELLQNAIDATKIECWKEYKRRQSHLLLSQEEQEDSFQNIIKELRVTDYPICISFKIVGKPKQCSSKKDDADQDKKYIPIEDLKNYAESDIDIGVLLTVKDFGTGISKKDLEQMTKVGSSYDTKQRDIYSMPDWMQPTGQFGIGLQSVFQVCKSFAAYTRTHNNERYKIEFNSVVYQGGYINTTPIENSENEQYGTSFKVFVSCEHKLLHKQCMEAWNLEDVNADRFSGEYEKNRRIRHSKELLTQMVVYINSLIGEPIFPICVNIDPAGFDDRYLEFISMRADKVCFSTAYHSNKMEDLEKCVSWVYHAAKDKEESFITEKLENGICVLDCKAGKFHIWDAKLNISAQLGAERLRKRTGKTRIYIRGIYLCEYSLENDLELLESLDINAHLPKRFININRNDLTDEGLEYVKQIYEAMMDSVKQALDIIAYEKDNVAENIQKNVNDLIKKYLKQQKQELLEEQEEEDEKEPIKFESVCESVLFLSCLSIYALIKQEQFPKMLCRTSLKEQESQWEQVLKWISESVQGKYDDIFAQSILKKIPVLTEEKLALKFKTSSGMNERKNRQSESTFPYLLLKEQKIGIISKRDGKHSFWTHYVILFKEGTYEKLSRCAFKIEDWNEAKEEWEIIGESILSDFEAFYDKEENKSVVKNYNPDNQRLLKWMLTNIPTHGIWSLENGNTRLNVLGRMLPNSVYYNANMKYLMLETIAERYNAYGGKRYLTITWKGYEGLALKEIPSSICFISRGYLNKNQKSQMLLPIDAQYIEELLNSFGKEDFIYIVEIIKRYFEYFKVSESIKNIYNRLKESLRKENTEKGEVDEVLANYLRKKDVGITESNRISDEIRLEFLIQRQKRKEELKDEMSSVAQNHISDLKSYFENMPDKQQVHIMASKIYYKENNEAELLDRIIEIEYVIKELLINKHKEILLKTEKLKELNKKLAGAEAECNNLYHYVAGQNQFVGTYREVECCYKEMLAELIELVYNRKIREVINQELREEQVQYVAGKLKLADM